MRRMNRSELSRLYLKSPWRVIGVQLVPSGPPLSLTIPHPFPDSPPEQVQSFRLTPFYLIEAK